MTTKEIQTTFFHWRTVNFERILEIFAVLIYDFGDILKREKLKTWNLKLIF